MKIHPDLSDIHTHTHAFIHDLRSVTYLLPPDFWTSLLLKLCDLAVHTVKQKNTKPRRLQSMCICVCAYVKKIGRGGERQHTHYTV